jgi:hypothetical protein
MGQRRQAARAQPLGGLFRRVAHDLGNALARQPPVCHTRPRDPEGHEPAERANYDIPGIDSADEKPPDCRKTPDGETRTRTGDTTIFSRVLYQLSYLAVEPRG